MDNARFKTVDEYIASFPDDVQAVLREIRRAIREAVPAAEEAISYQMPGYRLHGWFFYFAAWKRHYSLYPATPALLDTFAEELSAHEVDKSTIKFRHDRPVPVDLIGAMARFRAAEDEAEARTKTKRRRK